MSATLEVIFAVVALFWVGIAIVVVADLADRLPHLDILGDRETRTQERAARHALYRPTGTVHASVVRAPVRRCCECREPVFLGDRCAFHFEKHHDMQYDASWESGDVL